MNSSRLWDVRHLVVDRIDALEAARATLEELIGDAGRRREELRRRVEEAQGAWSRIAGDAGRAHPADIDEAFGTLSTVRSELAAVEERWEALQHRLADARSEQEVLRSVFHSIDDIAGSHSGNGGPNGQRQTSRDLFQGVEEQRRRIARDLREGPLREITELAVRADDLERQLNQRRQPAPQELLGFESSVRRILEQARDLVQALDATMPDELGLLPSLRRVVREFRNGSGTPAELRVEGREHGLRPAQQKALYRVVQEALDNVRRHSGATRAEVVLDFQPQAVRVSISDDGRGFDVIATEAQQDPNRAFGLSTMRERASLNDGSLQVRSGRGRGTQVLATFFG